MDGYHLDFETYSAADLKSYGAYRYAEDDTTEILVCAVARGDEAPKLWSVLNPDADALALMEEMSLSDAPIYAHNAQFEAAICKYNWTETLGFPVPEIHRWRCTQAMARRAAIPSSLAQCAAFLGLDDQKDKEGLRLIKKFSIPQKPKKKDPRTRILASEDPEEFKKFEDYCLQDVVVERSIHRKLKVFELKGTTLEAFTFDMEMNDRGIPVNVDALNIANVLVNEFDEKVTRRFREVTGLKPTQRDAFLRWLKPHNYPAKNLQAPTVEKVLENSPESIGMTREGWGALRLKQLCGFAALKKIPTMLGAANKDGRVRGAMVWSGAERTHRWAGTKIQPQNFKRPTIKDTEELYDFICTGKATVEDLEMLYPNPLEAVASCIRHFIQPKAGVFLNADYSAIEARLVLWLCGQEDSLQAFRDKKDAYVEMATKIFSIPSEKISKESRFVGKQAVLLCGYQGGADKFQSTCRGYGQNIPIETCEKAVNTYRRVNYKVKAAWSLMEQAAMDAIKNPGQKFKGTDKLVFAMTNKPGFPALAMQLPSGHCLIYPKPRIRKVTKKYKDREWEADEIQFYGKISGTGGKWGWVSTYGGKLLENATQGVAGDIMTNGALNAKKAGFGIFMLVHDEALSEHEEGMTVEDFSKALCDLPDWAEGLPLEAEGDLIPFYRKD